MASLERVEWASEEEEERDKLLVNHSETKRVITQDRKVLT